jgi:hypothetical protein
MTFGVRSGHDHKLMTILNYYILRKVLQELSQYISGISPHLPYNLPKLQEVN